VAVQIGRDYRVKSAEMLDLRQQESVMEDATSRANIFIQKRPARVKHFETPGMGI
jgi:hypothetical protein